METTKEIHPAMARLYDAATERLYIKGACLQSEFADWLNISPQRVNNWDKRGPSKDIRIRCQNEYGINATWVETGVGERFLSESPTKTELTAVDGAPIQLIPKSQHETIIDEIVGFLRQTDIPGLAVILDRAKDAARDYPIVKQTRKSS